MAKRWSKYQGTTSSSDTSFCPISIRCFTKRHKQVCRCNDHWRSTTHMITKIYNGLFHNQYLFGPYFLIAPVESNKEFVKVYLPEGYGIIYTMVKSIREIQKLLLNARCISYPFLLKQAPSFLCSPLKAHTGEVTHTSILHIYTGDSSTFNFYEDDGLTFDYQKGEYALRKLSYDHHKRMLWISKVEGNYTSSAKRFKLIFHGLDGYLKYQC